jgi:hypothetical protein
VYAEVAEYFGESARAVGSSAFFSVFLRFARAYRLADEENVARRRVDDANSSHAAQVELEQAKSRARMPSAKERQQAVVNELKGRAGLFPSQKQLLPQDQVTLGHVTTVRERGTGLSN